MSVTSHMRSAFASAETVAAAEERIAAARIATRQAGCEPIDSIEPRQRARAAGVLRSVVLRPRTSIPTVEAELYDGSGSIDLVWMGRRQIIGIEPGRHLVAEGMVTETRGRRTMYNPRYELQPRQVA